MADVKIFASIIDDKTKEQIKTLSESDAYKDCRIRVMPDCHAGKGCTIGSVIEYQNRVVPNTVGVDIGCGMMVTELGNIEVDLEKLDRVINEYIPSGFNVHKEPVHSFSNKELIAHVSDWKYMECSIGSLGGGNHFIELNADDEGRKYLVIHSGSRNLGVQVCDYWQNKAILNLTDDSSLRRELIDRLKAEGRQKEIGEELKKLKKPSIDNDLAYIEGEDLEGYINDMSICQNYASYNRATITELICHYMGWDNTVSWFNTIHNYIDIPNKIIRKGAIEAPAGRKVLIPMNMRDGSLICIGKGNSDWLDSAPHGAGRIMSRMQAKRSLNLKDFESSMQGIYTTSVCEQTIDEAPMVYKSSEQIMQDILPTVDIVKIIKSIYNFKAKQ